MIASDTRDSRVSGLLLAGAMALSLCCPACALVSQPDAVVSEQGDDAAPIPDEGGDEAEPADDSETQLEQESVPSAQTPPPPADAVAGAAAGGDERVAQPLPGVASAETPAAAVTTRPGAKDAGVQQRETAGRPTPTPDAAAKERAAAEAAPPAKAVALAPEPVVAPPPEPAFGVDELIKGLQQTEAIGVFTKLAIRSEALDLVEMVKSYRRSAAGVTLARLRSGFDGLLLKILALLDRDPELSRAIYQAREQLWTSLLEVNT